MGTTLTSSFEWAVTVPLWAELRTPYWCFGAMQPERRGFFAVLLSCFERDRQEELNVCQEVRG